uniref:Uncharacterized protein n=2 Tax=Craspedostauros australis TaxID=1486917 RepID=A0A7R9WTT3_9STRA
MLNYTVYGNKFGSAVTFPDPLSRFGDEVNEGLMVHSKAVARQDTAGWLRHCNVKGGGDGFCRIGFPWPDGAEERGETKDADGWKYNCYLNPKIDDFWVPKLEKAMAKYSHLLQGK